MKRSAQRGEQIRQRLIEKTLTGDDLVRWEDSTLWAALGSWEEFRDVLQPPVPADAPFSLMEVLPRQLGRCSFSWFSHAPNPTPIGSAVAVALTFWGLLFLAIVFGHVACGRIKRKKTLAGHDAARTGLWLGYLIVTALFVFGYLSNGPDRTFERGNITIGNLQLPPDHHHAETLLVGQQGQIPRFCFARCQEFQHTLSPNVCGGRSGQRNDLWLSLEQGWHSRREHRQNTGFPRSPSGQRKPLGDDEGSNWENPDGHHPI